MRKKMENTDILKAHEDRLQRLESSVESLSLRLGKTEDKASGAWNTIREINGRMDKMEKRIETMEADVKQIKSEQASMNKSLKVLIGVVAGLCVIVGGFLVYIWKHDADLAKSILGLGSMIGQIIA